MSRPILKLGKTVARRDASAPDAPRSTRAQRARPRPTAPARPGAVVPGASASVPVAPVPVASSPAASVPAARPESTGPGAEAQPRLSKRLGELGLCSRREAEAWIENGWVRVDGRVVDTLGVRVSREARIEVDPAATRQQAEQVTILLNKPIGYVSGQAEDGHPPAVVLVTPENRWSGDDAPIRFRPAHLRGLAPAGRLDIDSIGLLVLTQDGRIAKQLIGSDSQVEKEYLVRVSGRLSDEGLRRLRHGLELDGVTLRPAEVSWQNADQLRFVLREGRKRQIRRMCALVGLEVTGLKRVRSGGVMLGDLPPGRWRYLGRHERF